MAVCCWGDLTPLPMVQPATMERHFEFFVATDEINNPKGPDRRRLRHLVGKQCYNSRLNWEDEVSSSVRSSSASTEQAKTQLTGKFKLLKQEKPSSKQLFPRKKLGARSKAIERKSRGEHRDSEESGEALEASPASSHTPSGVSDGSTLSDKSVTLPSTLSTDVGEMVRSWVRSIAKFNVIEDRSNPFSVLPQPLSPQMDTLLKLYKRGQRSNMVAISPQSTTWWSFIRGDAGLLHATLATWASYGLLVQESSGLLVEALRHKSEAISHIKTRIAKCSTEYSDELVGIVLTLASFENLAGDYREAQLHISAVKRMVDERGGLRAFKHNDGLTRAMIWTDCHTAAASRTSPLFSPALDVESPEPKFPQGLVDEALRTSPTSLFHLSLEALSCHRIFSKLHRLALSVSSRWMDKIDRREVDDYFSWTEYKILSMPDYSREYLDFDSRPIDEQEREVDKIAKNADAASIVEALLAAAQIFVYVALRGIPPRAKIFSVLVDRVWSAVHRPNVWTLRVWKQAKNANMLLWVLTVTLCVGRVSAERDLWLRSLLDVMEELDIHSQSAMETSLKGVAWTDIFFPKALSKVWQDVCRYQTPIEMLEFGITSGGEVRLAIGTASTAHVQRRGEMAS